MLLSEAALVFATEAHRGQTRWDKSPYINHPIAVAEIARELAATKFSNLRIVESGDLDLLSTIALCHDVAEDIKAFENNETLILDNVFDIAGLDPYDSRNGFERARFALKCLNKNYHANYRDFILSCRSNIFARVVKYADLTHNLSSLTKGSMRDKYLLAQHVLEY